MKILNGDQAQPTHLRNAARQRGETKGSGFAHILEKRIEGTLTERPVCANPVEGLRRLPAAAEIGAAGETMEQQCRSQAEKALDLLEQYQQQLADPRSTLKTMIPLVLQIKNQGVGLSASLEKLPMASPVLDTLNETLIEISKEVVRFDQGAYLDE